MMRVGLLLVIVLGSAVACSTSPSEPDDCIDRTAPMVNNQSGDTIIVEIRFCGGAVPAQ